MKTTKKFTKVEKSWILYDWANSVYATNILAVIFPIYFNSVCKASGADNLVLWSYGTSAATFLVAVLAPVLGALADHKGHKKKLFAAFLFIGVAFTLSNAFVDSYQLLLAGYVLSHIGFSGSCLFYDSFLTDVTTPERMDRVSSWGYAMGYIGGSTIPFVLSIILLMVMGMDSVLAFKLVIILTSLWWLVFSIPMLKNVKQVHYIEPQKNLVRSSFSNLWRTAKEIFQDKKIFQSESDFRFHLLWHQAGPGQHQHDSGPLDDPDSGGALLHPVCPAGGENWRHQPVKLRGGRVFLHHPGGLLHGLQH